MNDSVYLRLAAVIQERDQRLKTSKTTIQRIHAAEVATVLEALRIAARRGAERGDIDGLAAMAPRLAEDDSEMCSVRADAV